VFLRIPTADRRALQRAELTLGLVALEVIVEIASVGRPLRRLFGHVQELFHFRVLCDTKWCGDEWSRGTVTIIRADDVAVLIRSVSFIAFIMASNITLILIRVLISRLLELHRRSNLYLIPSWALMGRIHLLSRSKNLLRTACRLDCIVDIVK